MNERTINLIKAATRDLISHAGGLERASRLAAISTTHLSRWQSPGHADLISLSAAIVLEAECGVPLVTRAMAEATGHRLVSREAEGGDVAALLTIQADLLQGLGQLATEVARAVADGRVTPTEAEAIRRAAAGSESAFASLRGALAGIKAEGGADIVTMKGARP